MRAADTKKIMHGLLMVISYAFCMSFGSFVARYLKTFFWWFPLRICFALCPARYCVFFFFLYLWIYDSTWQTF
jgi:hypothetical protein